MKRTLLEIAALALLLTAIDQLYRVLHPQVDLVRATLVGGTAWVALTGLGRLRLGRLPVMRGALAIFASAFLSVLAIEAGLLVSRSRVSAAVHVAILAAAYVSLGRRCAAAASATECPGLPQE
ncbi:MAG TPA: hypothetical protein VFY49_05770 [Myxococcota bacterium]|nr:hypothetical protein [Myxococcota bacterium]